MLNLILIICLVLCTQVWVSAQRDQSYISPGNEDCGITFPLKIVSPVTLNSTNFEPKTTCSWTFIGTPTCIPAISCSAFNLQRLDNDCLLEHLEVTDGTGAWERHCGPVNPFINPAKSNSRTLYVNLKSAPRVPNQKQSFECTIKCTDTPLRPLLVKHVPSIRMKEDLRCVCGLKNKDSRIVGGQDVGLNEIPWQVALVGYGTREPGCGGSIVNDRFILTAAHCLLQNSVESLEVLIHARILDANYITDNIHNVPLGEQGSIQAPGQNESIKTDEDEGTIRIEAEDFFIHPLFQVDGQHYDIALIKLKDKLDFLKPDAPAPVCLPELSSEAMKETYDGKTATVSGWGLAHELAGGSTRLLQKVELPIVPFKTCFEQLRKDGRLLPIEETQICAGYPEGLKDSCLADSGGPLTFQKSNKQWEQIGVVSIGHGCARQNIPGVYTRVTEFTEWILRKASEGTWCRRKL